MTASNIRMLVDQWIHVLPQLAPTLLGAGAGADGNSATARGSALGDDNSDPQAKGREIYANPQNLPTAIASIMNHSQKRADFHPASTPPEKLYIKFNDYVTQIDSTPFFHLEKHDSVKQTFYSKDYNKLIDQIANLYDAVSAQDKQKLRNDIGDMAKSVFGEEKSEQWRNLFSQSTIDFSDLRRPKLFIYYTTLHMRHEAKKAEVNEQEYTVQRAEYTVLADLIHVYADKLANLDKKSVDDWLDESTTPEREGVKLCFQ